MNMLETDQSSDLQQENSADASETPEGDLPANHDAPSKLKLSEFIRVKNSFLGLLQRLR